MDINPIFNQYRPFLVSFTFRMTGSLSDAEEIVQEAFMELAHTDSSQINNLKAWLTKVCANRGIDYLKAAYKKRETYPGTWLPDAIPESLQLWDYLQEGESVEKRLILSESLTTSFLLLIEKLSPEERVVYLLNEVFEYSFQEISHLLEKSPANCRKIAQRAREAIQSDRSKFKPSLGSQQLLARFFEFAKNGDALALADLLSDDSEFWSDGGGKVSVFSSTVVKEKFKISKFFASLGLSQAFIHPDFKSEWGQVNSRPGFMISRKDPSGLWRMDTILSFEIQDDKIARIYAQRNPEKLSALIQR